MEDTKKMDEASKPEELAERTPLTDEQLDQASGGLVEGIKQIGFRKAASDERLAYSVGLSCSGD